MRDARAHGPRVVKLIGDHPLRDPVIVRPLAASSHVGDMRRLGRQELQRLLTGSQAGRDALGLLSAARGGLSSLDLAELACVPLWEIEQIVHNAAGRTFTRRVSQRVGDPEIYLLGHEELQAAASHYLADRLVSYRGRLHAWADGYKDGNWPPETPEYLLSGYYQLLVSDGDLPRAVTYARPGSADGHAVIWAGSFGCLIDPTITEMRLVREAAERSARSVLAVVPVEDRSQLHGTPGFRFPKPDRSRYRLAPRAAVRAFQPEIAVQGPGMSRIGSARADGSG